MPTMIDNSPEALERHWEELQCADNAHKALERRKWMMRFALVAALVVLALTVATALASLGVDKAIR
jgi:hypothetical protein